MLSDAWNLARRRALDRLREEARQVGADAVVGVHLRHGDQDFGKRTIDYVVTGTAIRLPGSTPTELADADRSSRSRTTGACTTPAMSWSTSSRRPRSCSRRRRARRACAGCGRSGTEPGARRAQPARSTRRAKPSARGCWARFGTRTRPAPSASSSRTPCTARSSRSPRRCFRVATPGWHRGAASACPYSRLGPQRRQAQRLDDHDARRRHRDPPRSRAGRARRPRPPSGCERHDVNTTPPHSRGSPSRAASASSRTARACTRRT